MGKTVQAKGRVTEVCQKMGCWMNLADESGKLVRIKVTDGEIVFPKTAIGKSAIAEGKFAKLDLSKDQTVAIRKHEAEENGKAFDARHGHRPHRHLPDSGDRRRDSRVVIRSRGCGTTRRSLAIGDHLCTSGTSARISAPWGTPRTMPCKRDPNAGSPEASAGRQSTRSVSRSMIPPASPLPNLRAEPTPSHRQARGAQRGRLTGPTHTNPSPARNCTMPSTTSTLESRIPRNVQRR